MEKIDKPDVTIDRIAQLKAKRSLKHIYDCNYTWFADEVKELPGAKCLELGSGAGYLKEFIPDLITSDILELPNIDMVARAESLPFKDGELAGILMMGVLHHVPNNKAFLGEAQRTLTQGGRIIMIEPANTPWGRFIYQNLHHEPFEPDRKSWELEEGGPLSVANGALPWIILRRDHNEFSRLFPGLRLVKMEAFMPLSYLLSGGFSYPNLLPGSCFKALLRLEDALPVYVKERTGMFYKIVIERR